MSEPNQTVEGDTPPTRAAAPQRGQGMSEPRPLLTIAVPTWNRAKSLEVTMRSVLDQIETLPRGSVELLISDNASEDETGSVVQRLTAPVPGVITYSRNERNTGGIRNALRTLALARGEYWMFYGDDDIVPPDSLARMVNVISGHPDVTVFVFGDATQGGYFANLDESRRLTADQAARDLFYDLGNAGRFAIRSDLAASALDSKGEGFFRTAWPQTELAFLAASAAPEPAFLAVPFASSASTAHAENTAYTTYYLLRTTVVDLARAAADVAPALGPDFISSAERHIFSRPRMLAIAKMAAVLIAFGESPSDLSNARRVLAEGRAEAAGRGRAWYGAYSLLLRTPPMLLRAVLGAGLALKQGPRAARERMRELAEEAALRRQGRESGMRRSYGPGEL